MRLAFVSNYINHHQLPFCRAMADRPGTEFVFFETEELPQERRSMGWGNEEKPAYVRFLSAADTDALLSFDLVLFGDAPEALITGRLEKNLPTIRISESIYKEGQWKMISPRGLRRKYRDHIRFRKNRVWLLCAGGYVASDFSLIRAYPGKMLKWGYFPETRRCDIRALIGGKPGQHGEIPRFLWVGRLLDWKHPETALNVAAALKREGIRFSMELVGEGPLEAYVRTQIGELGLTEMVKLSPFRMPEEIRDEMEQTDIFLLCSDTREGWGAVANEAMNAGCALIACSGAGAVPFLVKQGENGLIYPAGNEEAACALTLRLIRDPALCAGLGEQAYRTITEQWNAETAAKRLTEVSEAILSGRPLPEYPDGPCAKAQPVSPGRFRREAAGR